MKKQSQRLFFGLLLFPLGLTFNSVAESGQDHGGPEDKKDVGFRKTTARDYISQTLKLVCMAKVPNPSFNKRFPDGQKEFIEVKIRVDVKERENTKESSLKKLYLIEKVFPSQELVNLFGRNEDEKMEVSSFSKQTHKGKPVHRWVAPNKMGSINLSETTYIVSEPTKKTVTLRGGTLDLDIETYSYSAWEKDISCQIL